MTRFAADIMKHLAQPPRIAMCCISPLGNTPFGNMVVPQALAQDLRQEHQSVAKHLQRQVFENLSLQMFSQMLLFLPQVLSKGLRRHHVAKGECRQED